MSFQTLGSCLRSVDKTEDYIDHDEDSITQTIGKVLHDLRKQRKLSLNDLARLSGVSRSMLSQIETGHSVPSVIVLCKIARTFDVPMTAFLGPEVMARPVRLSADETPLRVSADGKCAWRSLMQNKPERKTEFYEITLLGGGIEKVASYPPGSKANLAVNEGLLVVVLDGVRHRLSEGDVFEFPASIAHTYINPGHDQALFYLVLQLPRLWLQIPAPAS